MSQASTSTGPAGAGERGVDAAEAAAARHGVRQDGHAGARERLAVVRDDDDARHDALEHVELALRGWRRPPTTSRLLSTSAEAPGAAAGENGCSLHLAARGSR